MRHWADIYITDGRNAQLCSQAHARLDDEDDTADDAVYAIVVAVVRLLPKVREHSPHVLPHIRVDIHADEATYELLVEHWFEQMRGIVELHHSDSPHPIPQHPSDMTGHAGNTN